MIQIQKFDIEDYSYLEDWIQSEEELIQFAGPIFKFPMTRGQFEPYLNENQRKVFKVIYEEKVIGMAELIDLDAETNKIARVLIGDKSVRGKGIGTSLIQKLVDESFHNTHKKYVILNVFDWNHSAIRCYEKVGFVKTGTSIPISFEETTWQSVEMKITKTSS